MSLPATRTDIPVSALMEYERHVIRRSGQCWGWTGLLNKDGYGIINREGTTYYAHRVGYFVAHQCLDPRYMVLHKVGCVSRSCTSYDCLYQGTQLDNMRDCVDAGTHAGGCRSGERNHNSVLTCSDVSEIRSRLRAGEKRQPLADLYGVTYQNIRSIQLGVTWKEVP